MLVVRGVSANGAFHFFEEFRVGCLPPCDYLVADSGHEHVQLIVGRFDRRIGQVDLCHLVHLRMGLGNELPLQCRDRKGDCAPCSNAINVRLDGPNGTRIVWSVNDPFDGDGWSSAQLDSVRRLLPHIRQTVRVQQALNGAGALGASLANLLDTTGLGIVQLDGRGRVVEANDRARHVLRRGDGLLDEHGFLHARSPEDDAELQEWLRRALPTFGAQGTGASTTLRRASGRSPRSCCSSTRQAQPASIRPWPIGADRACSPADARITPKNFQKTAESPQCGGRGPECDLLDIMY